MSKSKIYESEALLSTDAIVEQLEKIVAGLKDGTIVFEQGEEPVLVAVKPEAKFCVEVKSSDKGSTIKLKLKWREAEEEESSGNPTTAD